MNEIYARKYARMWMKNYNKYVAEENKDRYVKEFNSLCL